MDVVELAKNLGRAIQADARYIRLQNARVKNDADEELQEMIGAFNLKRMNIQQEVSKEDKDTDKISALDKEIKKIYGNIMKNENMNEYNAAKQDMDALLQKVTTIVTLCANGEDPDTAEAGAGCAGDCSSCGGCH